MFIYTHWVYRRYRRDSVCKIVNNKQQPNRSSWRVGKNEIIFLCFGVLISTNAVMYPASMCSRLNWKEESSGRAWGGGRVKLKSEILCKWFVERQAIYRLITHSKSNSNRWLFMLIWKSWTRSYRSNMRTDISKHYSGVAVVKEDRHEIYVCLLLLGVNYVNSPHEKSVHSARDVEHFKHTHVHVHICDRAFNSSWRLNEQFSTIDALDATIFYRHLRICITSFNFSR